MELRPTVAKENDNPTYDVDRTTLLLIESCLNLAAQTAQLQISEDAAENIYAITDSLAQRFQIETRVYEVTDSEDARSITVYKGKKRADPVDENSPPIINGNVFPFPFRVIDGDKHENDNEAD